MLRALGFGRLILFLLVVGLLVFDTVQGRIGCLVWSPKPRNREWHAQRYVRTCAALSFVIVTRIDGCQRQSYLITWRERHLLIHRGDWVVPRLPTVRNGWRH